MHSTSSVQEESRLAAVTIAIRFGLSMVARAYFSGKFLQCQLHKQCGHRRTCEPRHTGPFIVSRCSSVPCPFISRNYPATAGNCVIASSYLFGHADVGIIDTLHPYDHAGMCMSASIRQTRSPRACGMWVAWWQMCTAPCYMAAYSCTQQTRRQNLASCACFMRYVTS